MDVSADDFVIQEAGVAREVLSVPPCRLLPIVVLMDAGNLATADFQLMQKAARHFIERIGQRPIALGAFGGPPKMLTAFEDERQTVMTRLNAMAVDSSAGSLVMQGASLAAKMIRETGALFSCIVVLSATQADASQDSPDEMIASVIDSNATLHVIASRPGQTTATASGRTRRSRGQTVARRVHGHLFGRVVGGARPPGGSAHRRDDDQYRPRWIEPNDVKVGVHHRRACVGWASRRDRHEEKSRSRPQTRGMRFLKKKYSITAVTAISAVTVVAHWPRVGSCGGGQRRAMSVLPRRNVLLIRSTRCDGPRGRVRRPSGFDAGARPARLRKDFASPAYRAALTLPRVHPDRRLAAVPGCAPAGSFASVQSADAGDSPEDGRLSPAFVRGSSSTRASASIAADVYDDRWGKATTSGGGAERG